MDKVNETRRALFEAKFITPYYVRWNTDRSGYYTIHRDSSRKHGAERYNANWEGFNAALDAVEVELPDERDISASDSPWDMQRDCRAAIESTGLGLRIKYY